MRSGVAQPAGLVLEDQPEWPVRARSAQAMLTAQHPRSRTSLLLIAPMTMQVDHKHGDRAIFETVAILQYLTALYDPEGRISYKLETEPDLWTEQQSWLAWAQGGLGPMQVRALVKARLTCPGPEQSLANDFTARAR